ncbi:MAG TPA: metallophosphoesterase [Planctomycetota bacterium]|nr:metallophosphoesterase [Planctomycetota bacterium]
MGSEQPEVVPRPGRRERGFRAAALACAASALVLLVVHTLSWWSLGPPAPAVLPPAGEVLEGKAPFRFGVVGDSHSNLDVFEAVLRGMKADEVSLVLHMGDLVAARAETEYDWLLHELDEARLGVPFCTVPGNHDIIKWESNPRVRCRLFSRSFGPRQYWFAYANALFVGFDSAAEKCKKEDLQWLDRTLSRLRGQFEACFVYIHVPPTDPRAGCSHCMESGAEELGHILKKHRVTALFAGHIHSYLETAIEGVPVYISGGGGGGPDEPFGPFHYLLCSVEPGGAFQVEKKDVVAASRGDYWEHRLLVVWPRRLGVLFLVVLMAAGVAFSVLAGIAQRRRLRGAKPVPTS